MLFTNENLFRRLPELELISLKTLNTANIAFLILGVVFPSFLRPFCLIREDEFLKVDKLLMRNNYLIFTKTLKIREIQC